MGWLAGWGRRVKITIDNTDITAALTNFPILIYLSAASGRGPDDVTFVFDEVGANYLKIAVTEADGTTECYVEVEKWDLGNEKAWLWAKIPSIASGADTDIYLYYDNDHADNVAKVGPPNSVPAENVWDSNFKFVCHMRDDPDNTAVRDSTTNDNDGAKSGAGTPAITVNGKINGAQDFDGTGDFITIPADATLDLSTGDWQIGMWVNLHELKNNWFFALGTGAHYKVIGFQQSAPGTLVWMLDADGVAGWDIYHSVAGAIPLTTWTKFELVRSGNTVTMYKNGTQNLGSDVLAGAYQLNNFEAYIGRWYWAAGYEVHGDTDEVRVATSARSAAWRKASYESETDDLLDFGLEQLPPSPWIQDIGVGATIDNEDLNEIQDHIDNIYDGQALNYAEANGGPGCRAEWSFFPLGGDTSILTGHPTQLRSRVQYMWDALCCTAVCATHNSDHWTSHDSSVLVSHDLAHREVHRTTYCETDYVSHQGAHFLDHRITYNQEHYYTDDSDDRTQHNINHWYTYDSLERAPHYTTDLNIHNDGVLSGHRVTHYNIDYTGDQTNHNIGHFGGYDALERSPHHNTDNNPFYSSHLGGHQVTHYNLDYTEALTNDNLDHYFTYDALERSPHHNTDNNPFYASHLGGHQEVHYNLDYTSDQTNHNVDHYYTFDSLERSPHYSIDKSLHYSSHLGGHRVTHYNLDYTGALNPDNNTHFYTYDSFERSPHYVVDYSSHYSGNLDPHNEVHYLGDDTSALTSEYITHKVGACTADRTTHFTGHLGIFFSGHLYNHHSTYYSPYRVTHYYNEHGTHYYNDDYPEDGGHRITHYNGDEYNDLAAHESLHKHTYYISHDYNDHGAHYDLYYSGHQGSADPTYQGSAYAIADYPLV